MFKKYLLLFKKLDPILLIITLFLVFFGLAAIYSSNAAQENPDFLNFKKQLIFCGFGLLFLLFFSFLDYRYLKSYGLIIYIVGLILLTLVLLFGKVIRGTRGWFFIFGQTFQPVEIAKIILLIVLSKYLAQWKAELYKLKNIILTFLFVGLMVLFVLFQPDFGSAIIFLLGYLFLLIILKIKKSYILLLIFIILVVTTITWFFILKDYQKDRIAVFFNPSSDPLGRGYNVKQSIIAVGSGQLFGRGLGLGPQSRLNFLPLQQTDFIFAVIAEELGFLGSILVLCFFIIFFMRVFKLIREARDDFAVILASSIAILFFIQTFVNIGMNIGILPVTGIPLPLVSYGGSSLIASMIAVGILESIYIRRKKMIF